MKDKLLAPIRAFKLKYLPLLAVYFAAGFAALDAVTSTFFVKNHLTLSAEALIGLAIWTQLPWSIKMVFGSIIDGVPLFKSSRKSYIYLGATLIGLGSVAMYDIASSQYLVRMVGEYGALLIAGLLTTCGVVMSDIVADTMAVELVEKDEKYMYNLGMVQVLSRLALSLGAVAAASLTGYLAATFEASTVFLIALVVPLVMVLGTVVVKSNSPEHPAKLDRTILLGGLGFGLFCVLCGFYLDEYAQLVVFCGSMIVINYMMYTLIKELDPAIRKSFITVCIAIFLFRVVPSSTPGIDWWYIDGLGFDQKFMGVMRLTSNVIVLGSLWFLANLVTSSSIRKTMTALVIIGTLFSMPEIAVYYGWNEYIGLTARQLLLTSNSILSLLANISMIPLGVLIAKHTPSNRRASFMALTASFMNMALVGGDIMTQQLSKIFVITRANFSQVGSFLVWSLVISTLLSMIGIFLLRKEN